MEPRKLFGTDGIRGRANSFPITPELVLRLGKAIALQFEKKGVAPKVVIGKDTRLSGYMIETALTSGLVSMGAEVMLTGPMPTPAVSFLVRDLKADAGIVISASHNPAEDNGIKIFDSRGLKLSDGDEHGIEKIVFSEDPSHSFHEGKEIGKAFRVEDARQRYTEFVKSTVAGISLGGLKVVIDCANGAGYRIGPDALSALGANTIAINNKPDGTNINKGGGATDLKALSEVVVRESADLGIALDGDADRVIITDSKGAEINGDRIMACLALDLKERGKLSHNTVVATVMSNFGFEAYMKENGIEMVRTNDVGDRYVIESMRKGNFNFGGEQSGHIIYGDYSTTGDGIITALQFIRLMKEKGIKASELANKFNLYPQVILNVKVREKKPIEQVRKEINKILLDNNIPLPSADKGRLLARYSGTENICRIMVEDKDEDNVKRIATIIENKIMEELG